MDQDRGLGQVQKARRGGIDRTIWVLVVITLLGGVIRFWHLERPPLLIDECFTFWRTCGSYGDLVGTLRDDGFVPLHYELLWWIGAGMPIGHWHLVSGGIYLTPRVMRFVPAVCGTLMIPAIYFVARQLLSRRASLLAALFVGCSAYALFFSRDSKMYMPEWFLGTLSVGCLMWWLRTRRSTAWLAWVAAGGAAAGFHIVTLLLLVLAPIYFLTQRRVHWKNALLLLLGCGLIVSGPAGYYGMFNRWTEKSGGLVPGVANEPAADANWDASGLNWISTQNSGAVEGFTSLSAYLTAFEWDGSVSADGWKVTLSWIQRTVVAVVCLMLGVLVVGAVPWRREKVESRGGRVEGEGREAWWRRVWGRMFMGSTGRSPQVRGFEGEGKELAAEATSPVGSGEVVEDGGGESTEPWWRVVFWLLVWIVVPAYGFFYLRSFDDPASPGDWLNSAREVWGVHWIWFVVLAVGVAGAATYWRVVAISLAGVVGVLIVAVAVLCACGEMELSSLLDHAVIRWVVLVVLPGTLWAMSGRTMWERMIKVGQMVMVLGAVMLICGGAHGLWDRLREESMRKNPDLPWRSIWETRYVGIVWPAVWIGVAGLVSRVPIRAVRWVAIVGICGVNLVNGIARSEAQTQVPYDRALADVWLSQAGSGTRTYFDLNEGVISFISGGGMPTGAYWKPIASYDACLAGRIKTTPGDFRVGKTWPFEYGAVMERFEAAVVYRPFVGANEIVEDVKKTPEARRVIVWETTHQDGAETDRLAERLGAGWKLAHENVVEVWWYWTWSPRSEFRRREYARK